MSILHDRRPSVRLIYDSSEAGCDLPKPFGVGIDIDPDLAAELDAAFTPEPDPVRDLLRSLGYCAANADCVIGWTDATGLGLDRCPVIEPGDVALVEDAIARSKAPAASSGEPFEPSLEERSWAAQTSPFERDYCRRLGLIPSAVRRNRKSRQFAS